MAWLPDADGVHFHGQGIIIGSGLGRERQKLLFEDRAVTLELRLRPSIETQNAPSILTLYDGRTPDILSVRQWRSHMVVWSRTDDAAARKRGKPYQEMGFRDALKKDTEVFITLTSGADGSAFYINGRPGKTYPRHRLPVADTAGTARLILGNSPSGESHWTGVIAGLAIYNRALTPDEVSENYRSWLQNDAFAIGQQRGLVGLYPFYERKGKMIRNLADPEDLLTIPETFRPVQRKWLAPPWPDFRWNWSFVQDAAVNLLGFVPAGFFFAAFLRRATRQRRATAYVVALIAGSALSLMIELTQAWLPARDSSLTDVACNAAGTMIGIATCHLLEFRGQSEFRGQYT